MSVTVEAVETWNLEIQFNHNESYGDEKKKEGRTKCSKKEREDNQKISLCVYL